jgi:broad specificity phosphatase PhoE
MRQMTRKIIYETHATSKDNESGIATGWLPGSLSALGRVEARALGDRRRHDGLAAIFSADLERAVETADIAFGGSGIPMLLDVRLRECNYGDLNGAPVAQLAPLRARHIRQPFPNGQSYEEVVENTQALLRNLERDWDGRRVLLIACSANRWALEHLSSCVALEDLVAAPFTWQAGWEYTFDAGKLVAAQSSAASLR